VIQTPAGVLFILETVYQCVEPQGRVGLPKGLETFDDIVHASFSRPWPILRQRLWQGIRGR
jgi:hypothetical protein